jgi:hypothetical protein
MSKTITVPCNVNVDFDVNEEIKSELGRSRKLGEEPPKKETYMGKMIEERHLLSKALLKKQMTFNELITFLNKR